MKIKQTYSEPDLNTIEFETWAALLGGSNDFGAGTLYGGLDDTDNDFFNR